MCPLVSPLAVESWHCSGTITSSVKTKYLAQAIRLNLKAARFAGKGFRIQRDKYRRDIQVLRGLAVLAVVLFHAKESYFPLGYLGVDVFFVISGFVVTPLILEIFTEQANGGGGDYLI